LGLLPGEFKRFSAPGVTLAARVADNGNSWVSVVNPTYEREARAGVEITG
jgi:hypothetical protein